MLFEVGTGVLMWLVQDRQLEMRRHADSSRLVRLDRAGLSEMCPDLDYGIRGRISGLLVSAGRAIDPGRVPCGDPCTDRA
jgi:hypothetical protein